MPEVKPNTKLVYAVHLASATASGFPGGANVSKVKEQLLSIIEYSGVVVMAPSSQNVITTEGSTVRNK